MFVELDQKGVTLLSQLVEARIEELGPEIRRSRTSDYHDRLKEEKALLEKILHQLHEAVWDPTC